MTQIRVIAGKYGGRKIDAPDFSNSRTKPMGERIRNAMFNRIGEEIRGLTQIGRASCRERV